MKKDRRTVVMGKDGNHSAGAQFYFVVNPASHSGKGQRLWQEAKELLEERRIPYEVSFSGHSGDIEKKVEELTGGIPEGETRTIVILGGDGTVNEALQGIRDFKRARFGYIPTGSGNDLARNLGITRDVRRALLNILEANREMRMDLGRVFWKEEGRTRSRLLPGSGRAGRISGSLCGKRPARMEVPVRDSVRFPGKARKIFGRRSVSGQAGGNQDV